MSEHSTGLKLLLSYEVHAERINEYRQFVMQQYIPFMQARGFQISEAWHTAYGDAPNRLVGFVCQNRSTLDALLVDEEWPLLNAELETFASDFHYKVVPYRGVFQT